MIGPGRSKSSQARQAGAPDAHDAAVSDVALSGEGVFAAETLEPPPAHATALTTRTAPIAVERRVRKETPKGGAIIATRVHAAAEPSALT